VHSFIFGLHHSQVQSQHRRLLRNIHYMIDTHDNITSTIFVKSFIPMAGFYLELKCFGIF